jgi:transposase
MTKTQVEVITSVQRRRRWSRTEKERIVAAALEPGAVASEVARAAGIHTSQLFRWRQQLCEQVQTAVAFNPRRQSPRHQRIGPIGTAL